MTNTAWIYFIYSMLSTFLLKVFINQKVWPGTIFSYESRSTPIEDISLAFLRKERWLPTHLITAIGKKEQDQKKPNSGRIIIIRGKITKNKPHTLSDKIQNYVCIKHRWFLIAAGKSTPQYHLIYLRHFVLQEGSLKQPSFPSQVTLLQCKTRGSALSNPLEKTPTERRRRKVKQDPRPYTQPLSILEKGSQRLEKA